MTKNDKNKDTNQSNKNSEGNKTPNVNPVAKQDVDNDQIVKGQVSGAPSQKSGSRGSADVQDGGQDIGSSAGSH